MSEKGNVPPKHCTIDTVARKAGVSPATVSRVMNRPESVSTDKRIKVLEAMEQLNYSPSPLARGLATDSLRLVGILIPNITNQANSQIVYGAMDVLEKKGYGVLLFDAREDLEREMSLYSSIPKKLMDGVIVIYGNGSEKEYELLNQGLPVVLAGPPGMDLPLDQLTANESLGFMNLIQYLYGLGHREIAFLYGSEETSGGIRRKKHFLRVMEEFGLTVNPRYLSGCEWTLEGGYEGAQSLFSRGIRPTALIGSSDQIAIGAMRYLKEQGYRIPGDISVTGLDNSPMSRFVTPSLTTLDLPHHVMGASAAELLLQKISDPGHAPVKKVLPLDVVARESSGPVRKD